MPRKKITAVEEPEQAVAVEEKDLAEQPPEQVPEETPEVTQEQATEETNPEPADVFAGEQQVSPDAPPPDEAAQEVAAPDADTEEEAPPETAEGIQPADADQPEVDVEPPLEVVSVDLSTPTELSEEAQLPTAEEEESSADDNAPRRWDREPVETPAPQQKNDRQQFFELDFHELDRELTQEERQEWNSIYASYRGRSALTGTVIGVDAHSISVWNRDKGAMERQTMYCAIVVPYRVRVVIPASEMWEQGHERPDFVLQNMVGATIDFIIIKVDRESGFAIGSRRLALRARRYFFSRRPALNGKGARLKCRVMSVGPRRCLVECYGHDINLTQRELRYTAIPDLRDEYHPGQELDCLVKRYDPEKDALDISVKETESNPFDGAQFRHPVGSRRQAVIAGKYGGGVFCNLPDGTVCMCNYSYQHEDSDFMVGDTVILLIRRYDVEKKQMYGKIMTKW